MKWIIYNTENIKGNYLFKFLSEKHLLQFLKTGNVWFSRADKFGDKMECVMITDLQKKPKPDFAEIEARKRRHLISCFHEGTKETLAFWDTYSKNDDERRKYALRFNRVDFINQIKEGTRGITLPEKISACIHGKVKYKNLIGASPATLEKRKVKYPAFRKEYAFAYEREYRFDIQLDKETSLLGINYSVGDPKNLDFSILVNPLLDDNDFVKCLNILKAGGYENKIRHSVLTKWLKPELWR